MKPIFIKFLIHILLFAVFVAPFCWLGFYLFDYNMKMYFGAMCVVISYDLSQVIYNSMKELK